MGDKTFYELNISSSSHGLEEKSILHKDSFQDEVIPESTAGKSKIRKSRRNRLLGTTFCIFLNSLIMYIMWQTEIYENAVAQYLILKNNSIKFNTWKDEPVTQTLSVYFFNYTNINAFELGMDSKLKIQEVGPYSYIVSTSRVNVTFNANGTVSFQERKLYHFSPKDTNGSLDDIIIVPNIPFLSAVNFVKEQNVVIRWGMSNLLTSLDAGPFTSLKVKDMLWGYDDRLFTLASTVLRLQENELPFKKFGLFASKNGTLPDVITIHTGETNIKKMGLISRFNGDAALNHWNSFECNRLDTSISSPLMPPHSDEKSTPTLYLKDACIPLKTIFQKTAFSRGVFVNRYIIPQTIFAQNDDNACLCTSDCLPSGVMNTSACSYGAPLAASQPHFLNGDPILSSVFEGLKPDINKHESFLNIEPNLGIIIDATSRIQLNVLVRNQWGMAVVPGAYEDKLILPTAWMQMKLNNFPDDLGNLIKQISWTYIIVRGFLRYTPIVTIILCIIIIVKNIYRIKCGKLKRSRNQTLFETKM